MSWRHCVLFGCNLHKFAMEIGLFRLRGNGKTRTLTIALPRIWTALRPTVFRCCLLPTNAIDIADSIIGTSANKFSHNSLSVPICRLKKQIAQHSSLIIQYQFQQQQANTHTSFVSHSFAPFILFHWHFVAWHHQICCSCLFCVVPVSVWAIVPAILRPPFFSLLVFSLLITIIHFRNSLFVPFVVIAFPLSPHPFKKYSIAVLPMPCWSTCVAFHPRPMKRCARAFASFEVSPFCPLFIFCLQRTHSGH